MKKFMQTSLWVQPYWVFFLIILVTNAIEHQILFWNSSIWMLVRWWPVQLVCLLVLLERICLCPFILAWKKMQQTWKLEHFYSLWFLGCFYMFLRVTYKWGYHKSSSMSSILTSVLKARIHGLVIWYICGHTK